MQAPPRVPSPAANPPPLHARGPSTASQFSVRQPVQSTPTQYAPVPPGGLRSPSPAQRPRATTDLNPSADVIYSTGRAGPSSGPARGPPPNPNMNGPGRSLSNASVNPYAPPSMPVGGVFSPQGMGMPPPPEVDTKTGGEAGMAGVGRRGFAAAARAAMFAHQIGIHATSPVDSLSPADQIPGMDGRRANAPRFLDIASATNYGESINFMR